MESCFSLFRSEMANNRNWEEQGQFVYLCPRKAVNSRRKTPQCWPSPAAGASWKTTDAPLLSLATSTSRKFTPPHTAGIKQTQIYTALAPSAACSGVPTSCLLLTKETHYQKLVSTSCKILSQHSRQKNVTLQQEFTDLGGKYVV